MATKVGRANSEVVTATYTFTQPTTPSDLAAINAGDAKVQLSWTASQDDTTPAANISYEICQTWLSGNCNESHFTATYTVMGETSFITLPLSNNTTFFFAVRAKDSEGNTSEVSQEVPVTVSNTPQWQATAYLKAPNAEGGDTFINFGDSFGHSVAVSGGVIVVGALYEDSNSTLVCNEFTSCASLADNSAMDAGAAYVFEKK